MAKLKNCWGQDLLPKLVTSKIPALGAQDGKGDQAIVYAKYFVAGWTWFATEFDPSTNEMFGKVFSPMCVDGELGYFSMVELAELKAQNRFPVERDINWKPKPLGECMNSCSV